MLKCIHSIAIVARCVCGLSSALRVLRLASGIPLQLLLLCFRSLDSVRLARLPACCFRSLDSVRLACLPACRLRFSLVLSRAEVLGLRGWLCSLLALFVGKARLASPSV